MAYMAKSRVVVSRRYLNGWTWLIVGCVLIGASFMVLVRSQFARWVGFIAAGVGALTAMTWMPYYPVWSLTYVGIAVLAFYGLAAHAGPADTTP